MAVGGAFETAGAAIEAADMLGGRVVVKADGLAAGKGVTVCETFDEAEAAIREAIDGGRFGASGQRVVVEQILVGVEASVIAICDGLDAMVLPAARDHKRLLDDDRGPNTGGMGAYSPVPELNEAALLSLRETVFLPVLGQMASRGTPFRGALFAGLMLTSDGPRVLEFNARLGDPETQVILPRLAEPLLPLLLGNRVGDPIARVARRGGGRDHSGSSRVSRRSPAGRRDRRHRSGARGRGARIWSRRCSACKWRNRDGWWPSSDRRRSRRGRRECG